MLSRRRLVLMWCASAGNFGPQGNQPDAVDFAGCSLRKLIHEFELSRCSYERERLEAVGPKVIATDLTIGDRNHASHESLSQQLVGHTQNAGLAHAGISVDDGLYLARKDPLSCRLDHLRLSARDIEVAFVVDGANVTGAAGKHRASPVSQNLNLHARQGPSDRVRPGKYLRRRKVGNPGRCLRLTVGQVNGYSGQNIDHLP